MQGGLQVLQCQRFEIKTPNKPENGGGTSYKQDHEWYKDDAEVRSERDEAQRSTEHLIDDDLIEIAPCHIDGGKSLWGKNNDSKERPNSL